MLVKKIVLLVMMLIHCGIIFPQSKVQAKIGILARSKEAVLKVKSNDRLSVGDKVRVYVEPQTECFVYLVFNDESESTLLSSEPKKYKASAFILLPSASEFYEIDNKSKLARFVVFCSADKLTEIESAFKSKSSIPAAKWKSIEDKLKKSNATALSSTKDKPFNFGGNIRASDNDFKNKLQVFSGSPFLIKTYDIEVKK